MYCAYLRKSRADRDAEQRGEGETLARHKQMLTELSEKLHNPISKWYQEVVSGDTIEARPVMQELLSDVEQGLWEGVYVIEVERLARGNTKDQGVVADAFKYSDTKIITLTKIYDPGNEFDEEYFEFGLFMSRREYKTINRRLQRGRIASAKEGNFVGGTAPYGYKKIKIPHDKGYTLEINEPEAAAVRQVYEWYCNGMGAQSIAAKLDELGYKPRLKDKWSRASIQDMLSNPTYMGKVRFGFDKDTKIVRDNKVTTIRKRNKECVLANGKHEAIISPDQYEQVQKIRIINKKNTVPAPMELQNPLSGLVYCEKCGALMTRLAPNTRNKYSTLKCPNRYCDNISAPLYLVEEELLRFLTSWLKAYKLKSSRTKKDPFAKQLELNKATLDNCRKEMQTTQKQLENAYTLLEQNVYSVEIFRMREASLQDTIIKLKATEDKLRKDNEALIQSQYKQESLIPTIENLLETYKDNTVDENNRQLKEVIDRITYLKTERNTKGNLNTANFQLQVFPNIHP